MRKSYDNYSKFKKHKSFENVTKRTTLEDIIKAVEKALAEMVVRAMEDPEKRAIIIKSIENDEKT